MRHNALLRLHTGKIYTMQQIPQQLADFLLSLSDNKIAILLLVNLFLVIIGMMMDDFSGTMLAALLLLPLILKIGMNPIHFAAIMGTNLGLGNVTPPCTPILYLSGRIGNASFDEYVKPALKIMLMVQLPVVLITTYVLQLSFFLPRLIMHIK